MSYGKLCWLPTLPQVPSPLSHTNKTASSIALKQPIPFVAFYGHGTQFWSIWCKQKPQRFLGYMSFSDKQRVTLERRLLYHPAFEHNFVTVWSLGLWCPSYVQDVVSLRMKRKYTEHGKVEMEKDPGSPIIRLNHKIIYETPIPNIFIYEILKLLTVFPSYTAIQPNDKFFYNGIQGNDTESVKDTTSCFQLSVNTSLSKVQIHSTTILSLEYTRQKKECWLCSGEIILWCDSHYYQQTIRKNFSVSNPPEQ